MKILIKNGTIVNEGKEFNGYIITENDIIKKIGNEVFTGNEQEFDRVIDASGSYVIPGVIDDQVHFREPGLTHKAEIATESKAAIAGGITSFMEMPNTNPPTVSFDALEWKFTRASEVSLANYSFYLGANNNNYNLLQKLDPTRVCGVKVFMGSSTGNMLVDKKEALSEIFRISPVLVATHCESESIIKANTEYYKAKLGLNPPTSVHPLIRSAEACYASTADAVELATKYGTQLHVLHLSTAKELTLFENKPLEEKLITNEVCVHHLWFSDKDYDVKGNFIKWNPAIKSEADRDALRAGICNGLVDVVATDHAPHTIEEKSKSYYEAPSGGPLVQHSLVSMLQMSSGDNPIFTVCDVVNKMSHAPAILYRIDRRGFLREGYFADIAIVKKGEQWTVTRDNIISKCGWSPFEDYTYRNKVTYTIVNGNVIYDNGSINDNYRGKELRFNR